MTRRIEVLYCDDIRQESSGKRIFIGVYNNILIVPAVPLTLPKFCISAQIVTPSNDPVESLRVKVTKNDEELINEPIEITPPEARYEHQKSGKLITISTNFLVSTMQISEPGEIKVLAETERETLESLPLQIVVDESYAQGNPNAQEKA